MTEISLDDIDDEFINNILHIFEEAGSVGTDSDSNVEDILHGDSMVKFILNCNNSAYFHAVKPQYQLESGKDLGLPQFQVSSATPAMHQRYDSETFRGILVDCRTSIYPNLE